MSWSPFRRLRSCPRLSLPCSATSFCCSPLASLPALPMRRLAKTLQPECAVLTFDLRGHGNSTEIDPTLYLRYPQNVAYTKGVNPNKVKLDYKDIDKNFYSVFINDIAAAKSYLERTKNDLGLCNTQNTVVIGVEQGATLAAIWANSEWYRYKIDFSPPFFQIRPENRPEGQYLSA